MLAKIEEKTRAKNLRSQGLSIKQIAKELNVAKSSVSTWVKDINLTDTQKQYLKIRELQGGIKGRHISSEKWILFRQLDHKPHLTMYKKWRPIRNVERFFYAWSPEMAYVLGYFAADGSMYVNKTKGAYVSFTSSDIELIESVKLLMKAPNTIEVYQPKRENSKLRYTIQIGSKRIFLRLLTLGFTPNKSLTLRFPDIPSPLFCHFLRGYFDGDGCAYSAILKRKDRMSKEYLCLQASFRCGSKNFLEVIRAKLTEIADTRAGTIFGYERAFTLSYGTKEDVEKLYNFMYPAPDLPYLKRKYIVLSKALGLEV